MRKIIPVPPGIALRGSGAGPVDVVKFRLSTSPESSVRMADIAREILPVNLEDEMRRSYLDYAMRSWGARSPTCATG
jgi:hypothetical protein